MLMEFFVNEILSTLGDFLTKARDHSLYLFPCGPPESGREEVVTSGSQVKPDSTTVNESYSWFCVMPILIASDFKCDISWRELA